MADNQWQELMKDWQTSDLQSTEAQHTALDVQALEQKTRRKAFNMSLFMWLDIIAAVLFVGFFVYLAATDSLNVYQTVVFAGVTVIIVPLAAYSVWVRRGLWQANGTDTLAYLALTRGRAKAGMNLAKANQYVGFIVFPLIIMLLIWRMFTTEAELSWPFNVLVGVTLIQLVLFAAIIFGSRYYYRVKEAEYSQTQQLIDDLQSD